MSDEASDISSLTGVGLQRDDSLVHSSSFSIPNERRLSTSDRSSSLTQSDKSRQDSLKFSKVSSHEQHTTALKPAKFHLQKRKSEAMLSVTQLRFSSLKLVAREEEKQALQKSFQRILNNRELVLISGQAGTGKTSLAMYLCKPTLRKGGIFAQGKFDLYQRDEPYAGIAPAFTQICGRIMSLRDVTQETYHQKQRDDSSSQTALLFETIQSELVDTLKSENILLLMNIIPELLEIVETEHVRVNNNMDQNNNVTQGKEETKARIHYAFRSFLRVVSKHMSPVVLLLDDLQWTDAATLDLLQVLVTDRYNPSLLVVGVYRSEEVNDKHVLSRVIEDMKKQQQEQNHDEHDDSSSVAPSFQLSEIHIGNLTVSSVNQIIGDLLNNTNQADETYELAEVCHKRTHGNVFSLLVFMEMLKQDKLLQFHMARFKWNWNIQKILAQTAATQNVVDVLQTKLSKLPTNVSQRLSVAACLGFSFEPAVLDTVWNNIHPNESSSENTENGKEQQDEQQDEQDESNNEEEQGITEWLDIAEKYGFLEKDKDGTSYRWVHDKVQEASMSLVSAQELPALKQQVGKILVQQLEEKDLDAYIFVVVSLLHQGAIPSSHAERIKLAELSLRASKKAYEFSAFEAAGKYAVMGVEALPEDKWLNHYELTLGLYSAAAEVAGYMGRAEEMEIYYNQVLNQTDRPVLDKLRVYNAMISYLGGALGRPNDAVELIVDILAQLGLRFPKRKASRFIATVSGALKAKRKIASLSTQDITNMPIMDDPVQIETMKLLDQLFVAAYLAKSDLMPLACLASARITLQHGLCEYSPPAFALLGLIITGVSGDIKTGSKSGELGLSLMETLKSRNTDSRTQFLALAFVVCWTKPIPSMISPLLTAYETGLSVGDTENACWCAAQYIVMSFQSGRALGTVEADCRIYSKQMIEFRRETAYADICIFLEATQNLMGLTEGDPTRLKSEDQFLSHKDHTVLGVFYSFRSILYVFFGEYEKGANLAIERGDAYAEGAPSHVWIMIETFVRGLALYAMARTTRKRIYKKHAQSAHKTIKSWIRKGNPNVKHYDSLLNAELAALKGNLDAAEGWYQSAIVSATRHGHMHESALASERYGEFLLGERNDVDEAKHKLEDAVRRYREWGATKKVDMLREKHKDLWKKPAQISWQADPQISQLSFAKNDSREAAVLGSD